VGNKYCTTQKWYASEVGIIKIMRKTQKEHIEAKEVAELLKRISESATTDTTSLSEVLRLCMRLGKQLENEELLHWARSEASGYKEQEQLPDYRVLDTEVRATVVNRFGRGWKNVSIAHAAIEKEHRDNLFKAHMMQPVAELERLAAAKNKNGSIKASWPADAIVYYQSKDIFENDLYIQSADRILTQFAITGILETIRTRVLDFVLRIEQELGVNSAATHIPVDVPKPDNNVVTQIFNTAIYNSENVAVGVTGSVTQNNVRVTAGDLESLKDYLSALGIKDTLIEELEVALEDDLQAADSPGPATQSWIGKTMIMIGKGTLSLAANASGSLIAEAIMRFLGIKI